MQEIKLSKFANFIKVGNSFCLYHSLLFNTIFINPAIYRAIKKDIRSFTIAYPKLFDILKTNKLLVLPEEDQNVLNSLREIKNIPEYSLLRILMTDVCNLSCKYCKVDRNIKNKLTADLKKEDLILALKQFQKVSNSDVKLVSITGGEPLVYFDKVKEIIESCSKYLTNYWIILFTNATLMTPQLAKYFKKNSIGVVVSLDGPKSEHDIARVDLAGKGSYDRVIKGFKILKKEGCNVGISCVVGKHNCDNLVNDIKFIINKLKPDSLGLNPLKYPSPKDKNFFLLTKPEEYAIKTYEIFEYIRKKGIFLEQINRRLTPFVEKKFKFYECGGCSGKNINLDARGNIGSCKSYLVMEKLCQHVSEPIRGSKYFNKLMKRSPIYTDSCISCSAIGICGGGCSYEAFVDKGDQFRYSNRTCKFSKTFLDLLLNDLYRLNKKSIDTSLTNNGYYYITDEDRYKIYGNVKITPGTLKYSVGHS